MNLNPLLINGPTTENQTVEDSFKLFPVYVRQEYLLAHTYNLHVQPGMELNLTLEGKAAYVIGNEIYMQSPGQLIFFPGNIPHQIYVDPSSQYKRAVICFERTDLLPETERLLTPAADFSWLFGTACRHIHLSPDMFTQVKSIVSLMSDEMQHRKTGWRQIVGSQFVSLTVLIGRFLEESERAQSRTASPVSVALCCAYIDKHLHEDLSLQSIARMFNISPEHLTRQFKREKGLSFYQYVLQQRVYESRRMLLDCPEMSLTDIAYAIGFTSSAQFSRVFKSLTLMSPTQFRLQSSRRPTVSKRNS